MMVQSNNLSLPPFSLNKICAGTKYFTQTAYKPNLFGSKYSVWKKNILILIISFFSYNLQNDSKKYFSFF